MNTMTVEQYEAQAAACDGLCKVPSTKQELETGTMPCVTCPFCKEIVTALLTPTSISCPSCKVTVKR